MNELQHSKDVHSTWKQGWVTKKEYGNTAQPCMDGIGKAKAQLEQQVVRDTQGKKSFQCYINSKRLNKENVIPRVNRVGDLVTAGTDKAERLNVIFERSPRPLCSVKGLEKEENDQQWMMTEPGISFENTTCTSPCDQIAFIQDCPEG